MLTEGQLIKFKDLYKTHFGKELNQEDAYRLGIKLMNLIGAIYKPITTHEYKFLQERRMKIK